MDALTNDPAWGGGAALEATSSRELFYELQVHHVELSMQNDELRRGEAALAASREAYRELYDRAPVGYVTLDERGVCLENNPMAATLLGVTAGALRGNPLAASLSAAAADALHLLLARTFAEGGPHVGELVVARPADGVATLQLDARRLERAGGRPVCHASLTDVSERRRMLEDVRVLNHALEDRVVARTTELAEANRRLERELAERTRLEDELVEVRKMEAIGRLAGGVAHDFNNLLTVMRLELALLRRRPHDEQAGALRTLAEAIDRAAALTSKLLTFARRQTTRREPVDLGAVAARLAPLLRRLLPHDVALEVDVPPAGAWVAGDDASLEQVVTNVALNARDAIDGPGTIALAVALVELDEAEAVRLRGAPGSFVRLAIHDDGCGMAPGELARMFEPFYTTKRVDRGCGLGLATVHGIVAAGGGLFDVTSEVGVGTRFTIYLPRIPTPASLPAAARRATAPNITGPSARPGETILIVDDHDALRRALREVLEAAGYRVLEAATGVAALAVLRARSAEVGAVISDVVMPELDGLALAGEVGRAWPSIPVLLISGYTTVDALPAAARFLAKPFEPDEVLRAVRAELDGRDARAAAAT